MATGLNIVRNRMAEAAARSGRDVDEITLVAVCKGRSDAEVLAVYDQGVRDFGENRAEALAARAPGLPADIRWHLVGTVQRRKVKLALPVTFLLHSLDRESLARSWASAPEPPPVLVQVNIAREEQKHGVPPEGAAGLIEVARDCGIDVRGLMTIPPLPERPTDSAKWFDGLRELRDALLPDLPGLTELSMGMTDDFEVAISSGATIIRVGRAIFEGGGHG